jgi:hypothetical protein
VRYLKCFIDFCQNKMTRLFLRQRKINFISLCINIMQLLYGSAFGDGAEGSTVSVYCVQAACVCRLSAHPRPEMCIINRKRRREYRMKGTGEERKR